MMIYTKKSSKGDFRTPKMTVFPIFFSKFQVRQKKLKQIWKGHFIAHLLSGERPRSKLHVTNDDQITVGYPKKKSRFWPKKINFISTSRPPGMRYRDNCFSRMLQSGCAEYGTIKKIKFS